jgi:hypothetical protein
MSRSTHLPALLPALPETKSPHPELWKPVIDFIDRFTARVVEHLEGWENGQITAN